MDKMSERMRMRQKYTMHAFTHAVERLSQWKNMVWEV